MTERDSAGVRVVSSRVEARAVPTAFRLATAPRLVLDPGEDSVSLAAVAGGALLPSGDLALALADGGLLRYASSGALRWARPGDAVSITRGPGDSITVLSASRDSAAPSDAGAARTGGGDAVLVVGPDGGSREVALAWEAPVPLAEAYPAGSGFVVLTGWSTSLLPHDAEPGLRSDPAHLLRFGADGVLIDTLATFPGTEVGLFAIAGRISLAPPHFPRRVVVASDGERVLLGTGEVDEISVREPDGRVAALVRREARDRRPGPADSAQARLFRQRLVGSNPLAGRILAELDRALPMPSVVPPYAALDLDAAGRIWVGDYPPPGEVPSTWSVYAPGGALLGQVALPPGFRLLDVGEDALLGVVPGAGPGSVRVYDLLPPAP